MLVNTNQEGNEKRKEKNASFFYYYFFIIWFGKGKEIKRNILYIYIYINHNM